MIYFTRYAENKFEILNSHKVYIRKEEVIEALKTPDLKSKVAGLLSVQKNNIKVIYQKNNDIKKVITFYPV